MHQVIPVDAKNTGEEEQAREDADSTKKTPHKLKSHLRREGVCVKTFLFFCNTFHSEHFSNEFSLF